MCESDWFKTKSKTDVAYRERKLVLDYAGVPQLIQLPTDTVHPIQHFINEHDWMPKKNTVGRGECDIKAFVWMHVCKSINQPFIVLTETKFSYRYIPVWARYSPHRTRVEAHANMLSP